MRKFQKVGCRNCFFSFGYFTGSSFWVYESIYICYGAIDLSYLQHVSENKTSNHWIRRKGVLKLNELKQLRQEVEEIKKLLIEIDI